MGIDPHYGDTLMYVSGNIMKEALKEALGEYLEAGYFWPFAFYYTPFPKHTRGRVIRPVGVWAQYQYQKRKQEPRKMQRTSHP